MYRNAVIIFVLALMLCTCGHRPSSTDEMTEEKSLPTTPVKDQGESHLGSLYAMLATIETEHLVLGDSVNLSAAYLVRAWLRENALRHYLSQGDADQRTRCTAATAIRLLQTYGMYPYDSYEGKVGFQESVLERKLTAVTEAALLHHVGWATLTSRLDDILDHDMGYLPGKEVHFLGADYTPTEFARSVCAPDEYLRIVSHAHLPYGKITTAMPDIEDSTSARYVETRNLPLDSLMAHVRWALEAGHPVCWEGDMTNPDDTLNHAFAIVGIARNGDETYFRCKNSQGSQWGNAGYVYLSESYLRKYTMAVTMTHTAFLQNGVIPATAYQDNALDTIPPANQRR